MPLKDDRTNREGEDRLIAINEMIEECVIRLERLDPRDSRFDEIRADIVGDIEKANRELVSYKESIGRKRCDEVVARICRAVIRKLQRMEHYDCGPSAPYLNTVWDAICAEHFVESGIIQDYQEEVVMPIILSRVEKLTKREAIAICTYSPEYNMNPGIWEKEADEEDYFVNDDIAAAIWDHLWDIAGSYTNKALRAYQEDH